MAFRKRSFRRRTFRRRPRGGGRWGDAGRKAGIVRARREWTGYYEDPACGGLVELATTQSDECWSQQDTLVLPPGTTFGDDNESTLMAFKGWFQPWTEVNYDALAGGGTPVLSVPVSFVTGVGFGMQLVPWRGTTPATGSAPRNWADADNSDWLVRKWYPYAKSACGITNPGFSQCLMPMFDEESMQIDITPRKVDWSEWALWFTIAIAAAEDQAAVFYQFQGRLLEQYVGGQSVVG